VRLIYLWLFDEFIRFVNLVKTLKDKHPATTKTTQQGRADKKGTEL
jgi:hypothetical protein